MLKIVPNPPPGFDDLSVDAQIAYVQALWDRIAATPEQVPVPDWHREVLKRRLEELKSNPDPGRPWDEVRRDIERKLGESSSRG